MPWKITIPVGTRFGRLTVLGESPQRKGSFVAWGCRCDCGMIVIVAGAYLRAGHTLSCGCLLADRNREIRLTHGLTKTIPEYSNWQAMRQRCLNASSKQYPRYGGRGITICPEWSDFEVFYRDMGSKPSPTHTLDRIDNDGNYEPANCRWATPVQQVRNRSTTRMLTYDGQTRPLGEWAEIMGITWATMSHRVERGWTPEQILTSNGPGNGPRRTRTARTLVCAQCQQPFMRRPSRISAPAQYCSLDCAHLARRRRVTIPCDRCGKPVERHQSHAGRSALGKTYCNVSCQFGTDAR